MVSLGKYVFVQVLVILVEISRTSAQSCGSSTIELKASSRNSLYVTSPNYPSDYPPSQICHWKITAPAGYVVELTFLDFYVEGSIHFRSSGCSNWISDHLEIYDGHYAEEEKLLGRYCSTYLPPKVFSSGTSLFLEFKSDEFTEGRGFKLEYSAKYPKPDGSICSPFNEFYQNNIIQLSGTIGYIESPLYGTKYPSNMQCTWVITVPKGNKIKLTFLDFSVGQKFYICSESHDYVEIRDGQSDTSERIGGYCTSSKPSPIHSSGRHLWIRFKSNSDNYLDESGKNTNGFRARYEEEMSDAVGAVIGIVIAIFVVAILILVCVRRRRRRLSNRAQMRQPITQPSAPSYPTVHYSPTPQSSYPPPSNGHPSPQVSYQHPPPGSTGDAVYTPQPSAPINDHPSGTFLSDPPPAYPEVVPDVPPPPYPGISPNPSHISTTQHPTTS